MCGPTVGIHTIYFLVLAIFCPSQSNVFIKHCYIGRWVQKQVMFIVMEHLLRFDFDAYVVGSKMEQTLLYRQANCQRLMARCTHSTLLYRAVRTKSI